MASENVKEFTDGNFEAEVLKSDVPVLVDFWAEWCMPCRMLTPTIEKIAMQITVVNQNVNSIRSISSEAEVGSQGTSTATTDARIPARTP